MARRKKIKSKDNAKNSSKISWIDKDGIDHEKIVCPHHVQSFTSKSAFEVIKAGLKLEECYICIKICQIYNPKTRLLEVH